MTETRLAPAKGTLIRMEGYALSPNEVKWHAERCAAGFALPVHLGEELLPAPFRLDGRFIQKNVGAVWFNHVGAMPDITRSSVLAYYQGLPITVPFHKDSDVGRATIVVHIDEAAYPATSPDRSRLCNSEVFERDLIEAVRKHWQDFLDGEWRSMPAEAFVERYWRLARRVGSDALLNATPVLPEGVLSTFDGSPVLQDRDELFSPLDRAVTRAEVEARTVVLARDPDDEDSDETRAFLTLAYRLGWVFVSDLPSSHWANDYVVSIDDVVEIDGKQQRAWSVDVGFEVKAQRRFVGCEVSAELALVDRYAITLADAGGQFGYSIEEESRGLYWDGCMVVPAREDGAMLVRQASRYQTEFEEFLEAEYEEDDSALQNLVAELRGRSAAETVYMLLNQAAVVCKPGVPGSVCVVIFGAATDPGLAHKETHVFELSPASIDKLAVKHPIEAASLADAAAAIAPLVSALTGKTARDSA